jgi:hypothetical protein
VNRNANIAFREMLTEPDADEQIISSLANVAAERVWWAAFNALHGDEQDEKTAQLQKALYEALHWALHIAQSITRFSNASDPSCRESALEELYHRPFIMFDTYDESHSLIPSGTWMRYERPVPPPPTLDHFGELVGGLTTEEGDDAGQSGFSDAGRALRRDAAVYMALLEWLVTSRERNKLKVRDSFLFICSLALHISANAALVLWEG